MDISKKRDICMKHFNAQKDATEARTSADIEKYRKGDAKIIFKDNLGNPLEVKNVKITQKTHDFKFGANIFMLDEFTDESENSAYKQNFKNHFNLATVPFYWDGLEPTKGEPRFEVGSPKVYRRPTPDLCVDFCKKNGILPKLHCLFYDKFIPSWLPFEDKEEMKRLYEKRFKEIAERYKGKLWEFEVTNETLCYPDLHKKSILSRDKNVIKWAFELARKYFGDETLVINEANLIPEIAQQGYASSYMLLLETLFLKGVSINKIGIQNHIFAGAMRPLGEEADEEEIKNYADNYMNPAYQFKGLDHLSEFGLPLEITEVTIPTLGEGEAAEELQADILEQLYTIWFSIPQMESVVYWNTVDYTAHIETTVLWNENNCRGGLFHRDLTPKKSAERLYYLFNKKWHTDLVADSTDEGALQFRGFYGDYTAETNGKAYNFGLHKNCDNTIEIVL